jgi:hypothetical protein
MSCFPGGYIFKPANLSRYDPGRKWQLRSARVQDCPHAAQAYCRTRYFGRNAAAFTATNLIYMLFLPFIFGED